MKIKIIKTLGYLFILLFFSFLIFISMLIYTANKFDKTSYEFTKSAIFSITSNWDVNALTTRASQNFLKNTPSWQLNHIFGIYKELGGLKKQQLQGQATLSMDIKEGVLVTAKYSSEARFKNGTGHIQLFLIKENGNWKIHSFNIDSDKFFR